MTTKVRCVSNGVITMAAVAVLGFPMMALAAKQVSVTLITSTLNNPFFVSVVDGAKAEAKSEGINLDVENAKHIIINKRSMGVGYAGIDNDLFYNSKTSMLFGDAKKVLTALAAELKAI